MSDEAKTGRQAPAQETAGTALPPGMAVTVRPIEPMGNLLGFASVKVGPFTMDNFKILEGEKGLFVGLPSRPDKGSDTGYRNTVWLDKGSKEAFDKVVLQEYGLAVEQKRAKEQEAAPRSAPEPKGVEAQMAAAQKQADHNNATRPAPAKKVKQNER